jgi:hypothetical protein
LFWKNCFDQGCQMVYFCTKNTNAGIFWRTLEWKMLVYLYYGFWNIVRAFGIICGHLKHFSRFVMLYLLRKIWQPWFRSRIAFTRPRLASNCLFHVVISLKLGGLNGNPKGKPFASHSFQFFSHFFPPFFSLSCISSPALILSSFYLAFFISALPSFC